VVLPARACYVSRGADATEMPQVFSPLPETVEDERYARHGRSGRWPEAL